MRYQICLVLGLLLLLTPSGCLNADAQVRDIHGEVNGIKSSIDTTVTTTAKLAEQLDVLRQANLELKQKLELQNNMLNDMKLQLGSMSATMQAGFGNKSESTNVGHDLVNYLPTSAVNMIVDLAKLFSGIVTALVGLLSTALVLSYRAAAARDRQRAQSEAEERQAAHQILVDVLATLDPGRAKELQHRIEQTRLARKPA